MISTPFHLTSSQDITRMYNFCVSKTSERLCASRMQQVPTRNFLKWLGRLNFFPSDKLYFTVIMNKHFVRLDRHTDARPKQSCCIISLRTASSQANKPRHNKTVQSLGGDAYISQVL
jgi:hypothetical protein